MIKKIFYLILSIILCLTITSCGGATFMAGLKFKKSVNSNSNAGNPSFTTDVVKLSNKKFIGFSRPMGNCGAGVTFFGIVLPIIPIWVTLNSCEKSFVIAVEGKKELDLRIRYDNNIYDPISIESKVVNAYNTTEYKFQIPNFWSFRMADEKSIIVITKTADGKNFTEELPVKWGVMAYNSWAIP
jgi:hypothetical protein